MCYTFCAKFKLSSHMYTRILIQIELIFQAHLRYNASNYIVLLR